MAKRTFYHTIQKFSYGNGKEEIRDTTGQSLQEVLDSLESEYYFSDYYRGCEIIEVTPSKEWFKEQLKSLRRRRKALNEQIYDYETHIHGLRQ